MLSGFRLWPRGTLLPACSSELTYRSSTIPYRVDGSTASGALPSALSRVLPRIGDVRQPQGICDEPLRDLVVLVPDGGAEALEMCDQNLGHRVPVGKGNLGHIHRDHLQAKIGPEGASHVATPRGVPRLASSPRGATARIGCQAAPSRLVPSMAPTTVPTTSNPMSACLHGRWGRLVEDSGRNSQDVGSNVGSKRI